MNIAEHELEPGWRRVTEAFELHPGLGKVPAGSIIHVGNRSTHRRGLYWVTTSIGPAGRLHKQSILKVSKPV